MNTIKSWRFLLIFVLLGLAALYVYNHPALAVPANKPLELLPQRLDGWGMTGQDRFDERVLEVLLPTDYVSRAYRNDQGQRLGLYIGYHGGGPDSGPIHSPKQCLPGSGWERLSSEAHELQVNGQPVSYVAAVYQKGAARQLFLYWFQVRDQSLTNEYALKLELLKNALLSNRRDSSFVRLAVTIDESQEQARQIGEDFMLAFVPAIRAALPQ